MDSVFIKIDPQFSITQEKKLIMLRMAILCLSTHPDNEPNSEFADRIDDLELIIEHERRLSEIQLPTEEEITSYVDSTPYYGFCTTEYKEGLSDGIKWLVDHIKKGGAR